jgi:penicillin-insensitive murein endopeptidase
MNVVAGDGMDIDPKAWTPQHRLLLEAVAREPLVRRVFVNPAIKRALCREAGPERFWKAKIRRGASTLSFPTLGFNWPIGNPQCRGQVPPPPGDGCGKELDWWFTKRRFTRLRHRPEDRCGSATWRRPVSRASLHQTDKHCSL